MLNVRLEKFLMAVALLPLLAPARAENDIYDCVIQTKKHYLPNQRNLLGGPNEEQPGRPNSHFRISRKTGEIEGFNSNPETFSKPALMQQSKTDSTFFIYYAEEKDGSIPVLHVNIYESTKGPVKPMQALFGRLVFNGTCQ